MTVDQGDKSNGVSEVSEYNRLKALRYNKSVLYYICNVDSLNHNLPSESVITMSVYLILTITFIKTIPTVTTLRAVSDCRKFV